MADEPNKDQNDLSKNPQFAQLMGVVTQLGKGFQNLVQTVQNQGANFDKLAKALENGAGGNPQKKEDPPPSNDDINNMSQADLVAHMFKGMRGMMENFGKELNTKIEGLSSNFERNNLMTEVEKVRGEHKDFDEWLPEIKEKMTANPNLSLAEAYTLVRASNKEKATQMDDKYKKGLDDDVTDPSRVKTTFGGLLPTSGGIEHKDDDGKPKTMTAGEAAATAWDSVFGENPALAGSDEED